MRALNPFRWLVPLLLGLSGHALAQIDPLPSWNDGASKARIVAFVNAVSEPGGKDFVPPAERIAVFDNDGTLWAELILPRFDVHHFTQP